MRCVFCFVLFRCEEAKQARVKKTDMEEEEGERRRKRGRRRRLGTETTWTENEAWLKHNLDTCSGMAAEFQSFDMPKRVAGYF